jgi:hypothetical protein
MHSLLSALQRARHLLCKGARELASEAQVGKAVQVRGGLWPGWDWVPATV